MVIKTKLRVAKCPAIKPALVNQEPIQGSGLAIRPKTDARQKPAA